MSLLKNAIQRTWEQLKIIHSKLREIRSSPDSIKNYALLYSEKIMENTARPWVADRKSVE